MPIPIKRFPGINFFELILGPKGSTQKRIEEEKGVKLTISGSSVAQSPVVASALADGFTSYVEISGDSESATHEVGGGSKHVVKHLPKRSFHTCP